jgi:hypothetical protein
MGLGPTDSVYQPGGVDDAVDQIARRAAFIKEHPEWRIWRDGGRDVWYGERTVPGGWEIHVRYTLGWLLDALDAP